MVIVAHAFVQRHLVVPPAVDPPLRRVVIINTSTRTAAVVEVPSPAAPMLMVMMRRGRRRRAGPMRHSLGHGAEAATAVGSRLGLGGRRRRTVAARPAPRTDQTRLLLRRRRRRAEAFFPRRAAAGLRPVRRRRVISQPGRQLSVAIGASSTSNDHALLEVGAKGRSDVARAMKRRRADAALTAPTALGNVQRAATSTNRTRAGRHWATTMTGGTAVVSSPSVPTMLLRRRARRDRRNVVRSSCGSSGAVLAAVLPAVAAVVVMTFSAVPPLSVEAPSRGGENNLGQGSDAVGRKMPLHVTALEYHIVSAVAVLHLDLGRLPLSAGLAAGLNAVTSVRHTRRGVRGRVLQRLSGGGVGRR